MLHKQPLLCKKFMMKRRSVLLQTLPNAHYGPIPNPYNSAAWLVSVLIGTHPKDLEKAFSGPDERLTSGMQTFAGAVANVCGNGCNALRLRRAKLAPKSPVLFWIREYLRPSLHVLAGKILLEGYL